MEVTEIIITIFTTMLVVVVSWISLHARDLCYLIMTIIFTIIMKIIKG
uniref:Uncharacterized protein n=1 Tax=Brassica oleracea TaxID=3712 RepID=A0A3P6DBB9_BRAOL|nr:unnamed protein product [Brassica oleracea]